MGENAPFYEVGRYKGLELVSYTLSVCFVSCPASREVDSSCLIVIEKEARFYSTLSGTFFKRGTF